MTYSASMRVGFAIVSLSMASSAQVDPPLRTSLVVADAHRRIVKTLDANGDGWEDAVGWWTPSPTQWGSDVNSGYLRGWTNDGTGRLVDSGWYISYYTHDLDPVSVDACEIADLDDDDDDDFVTITWVSSLTGNPGSIKVFLSNGSASPTLAIEQEGGGGLQGVALADFDLDGNLDLAVAREHELAIYSIDLAAGSLSLMSTIASTALFQAERLVAAELSGDTTPDLLVNGNRIYPVIGGQIQSSPTVFPDEDEDFSKRHNAEDIDGDGDVDVLSFLVPDSQSNLQPSYRVLRRTGASTFIREPLRTGGPARRLADLDADGDLDGVCCGGGGGTSSLNVSSSYFRIALNDGTGNFAGAYSIPSMGSAAIGGVVDLDHDGDQDLVAGRCVFYADGPITQDETPKIAGGSVLANAVADVDADGDPDYDFQPVTFRRNLGDGQVELESIAFVPPPATWNRMYGAPVSGDFDGDGDPDGIYCVTRYSTEAGQSQRSLELVKNLGYGVFESAGLVSPIEPYVSSTDNWIGFDGVVFDIGGDGDLDFAVADTWWRNDAGTFVRQTPVTDHFITWAGDLNGDDMVDLLAHGPADVTGAHPMRWREGTPTGDFGAWHTLHSSSTGAQDQVAVADFDEDGDVEVVAMYRDYADSLKAKDAFIHWNNGSGGFLRRLIFSDLESNAVRSARAIDFDGDGWLDVALGGLAYSPLAVTLLLHEPIEHVFGDPIHQVVFESGPGEMSLHDVDGDGDEDILTQRSYRSRRFNGVEGGARVQLDGGTPGQGGVKPILGATGPFRVGERVRLLLRGLRPDSRGVIAIGAAESTTLGVSGGGAHPIRPETRALPFHATGSPGDAPGSGWCEIEFMVPAAYASSTRSYVAHVIDDAAPGGRARSNQLLLTYGP